jgi:hypothetical protein
MRNRNASPLRLNRRPAAAENQFENILGSAGAAQPNDKDDTQNRQADAGMTHKNLQNNPLPPDPAQAPTLKKPPGTPITSEPNRRFPGTVNFVSQQPCVWGGASKKDTPTK